MDNYENQAPDDDFEILLIKKLMEDSNDVSEFDLSDFFSATSSTHNLGNIDTNYLPPLGEEQIQLLPTQVPNIHADPEALPQAAVEEEGMFERTTETPTPRPRINKRISDEELANLAINDPRRAKRIITNRKTAVKSKEKKRQEFAALEEKIQAVRSKKEVALNELAMKVNQCTLLEAENKNLMVEVESTKANVGLQNLLIDQIRMKIQNLNLMVNQEASNYAIPPDQSDNPSTDAIIERIHDQRFTQVMQVEDFDFDMQNIEDMDFGFPAMQGENVDFDDLTRILLNDFPSPENAAPPDEGFIYPEVDQETLPQAEMEGEHIVENTTTPRPRINKRISDEELLNLELTDPRRARRITTNRKTAVKSKEKKRREFAALEEKIQAVRSKKEVALKELAMKENECRILEDENKNLMGEVELTKTNVGLQNSLIEQIRIEIQNLNLMTNQQASSSVIPPPQSYNPSADAIVVEQQLLAQPLESNHDQNSTQGMQVEDFDFGIQNTEDMDFGLPEMQGENLDFDDDLSWIWDDHHIPSSENAVQLALERNHDQNSTQVEDFQFDIPTMQNIEDVGFDNFPAMQGDDNMNFDLATIFDDVPSLVNAASDEPFINFPEVEDHFNFSKHVRTSENYAR